MKKLLTILLVLVLTLTALAACGKNNDGSQGENNGYNIIYSEGSQLNIVLADKGYAAQEKASEMNRTLLLNGVKSSVITVDGEHVENEVIIGKCDVADNDDLTSKFGIRNIPTVLFIKNGEVVDKTVGAATKAAFAEKIEALL